MTGRCVAGLWMPDEGVIDPMALTVAYANLAATNGASLRLGAPVTAVDHETTAPAWCAPPGPRFGPGTW